MRWTVSPWLRQTLYATPPWLVVYTCLSLVAAKLPLVRHIPPISPAILIYAPQDSALPLLLSPFLIPSRRALFSRLLYASWLCVHLSSVSPDVESAALNFHKLLKTYGSLIIVRSLLGYLLTRSVGWTYPVLLAPYTLYEPLYGIGPLVVGVMLFGPGTGAFPVAYIYGKGGARSTLVRLASLAMFAMVDGMPWGYACAAGMAGIWKINCALRSQLHLLGAGSGRAPLARDDEDDIGMLLPFPRRQEAIDAIKSRAVLSKTQIVFMTLSAIVISWVFGSIPYYARLSVLRTCFRRGAAATTSENLPLTLDMHIIMLTYPRDRDLSSDYMIDSIQSYFDGWRDANLPSSSNTTLTVYGHTSLDGHHRAWDRAKTYFSATGSGSLWRSAGIALDFVMHPPTNRPPSHYAHLSDALHHAYHFKHEWIMVVEDDFAVCGAWGMEGIVRVLLELGSSLIDSADADVLHRSGIVDDSWKAGEKRHAQWRGAFVGTGGSGLILHHTLLPTVIRLLELVAGLSESGTPLPRTPPDVLVQQCLSGEIALCTAVANPTISPKYSHSQKEEFERSPYPTLLPIAPTLGLPPLVTPFAPPAFLISSRLLMSHTGHALSTGNRFYLEGQWACGWRQPMLGNRGVSVVVV